MTASAPRALRLASHDRVLGVLVDELTTKLRTGESIDLEAYVCEHAEHAESLRRLFPTLHVLADLGRSSRSSAVVSAEGGLPTEPLGTLGDFRLVREIGRGGMGVVYEAEQISLNRQVALKVLAFAAALDAKQLQRFRNEAQAAANLHHTNIVPVFAVGCERGVHFYAMQYIDGQTLAAVIRDLRQSAARENVNGQASTRPVSVAEEISSGRRAPIKGQPGDSPSMAPSEPSMLPSPSRAASITLSGAVLSTKRSAGQATLFRTVAHLGVQAAEALEHAHQLGVVHRDIKPANILVDLRGNLWITDFGLARFHTDAGLTLTGDLVGTIRYMSPEQASAKRGSVDQRTDIYSLGVTLYELLTLEPACDGRDRQEVLRQIDNEEPRAPRRLNPEIPTDLDTVILKAIAKNPVERYASAQELADDLRRFLEHKPIRARRPAWHDVAAKWARRHRTLVRAAAVLGLIAVTGLAVFTFLLWREQQRTESEKRRAESNARLALQAANEMYTQVAKKLLADAPHLTGVQRQFFQKALHFYQEFSQQNGTSPQVRQATAMATLRVGSIQQKLGQVKKAEEACRQATALLEEMTADFPDVPAYRHDLSLACCDLGHILYDTGRYQEAEATYQKSIDLLQLLSADFPDRIVYRNALGAVLNGLGLVLAATGRPEMARATYLQAQELQLQVLREQPDDADYQLQMGHVCTNLGALQQTSGQLKEAEQSFSKARDLQEKLMGAHPHMATYRFELSRSQSNLGNVLRDTRRPKEAEAAFHQAIESQERLVHDFPDVTAYQQSLSHTHNNLGNLLQATGQFQAAEEAYRRSVELKEHLAADAPDMPEHREKLANTLRNLGSLLQRQGRDQQSDAVLRRARQLLEQLVAQSPTQPSYRHGLAGSHLGLGLALRNLGRFQEAEEGYRQALGQLQQLVADQPEVPAYRMDLAGCHSNLAWLHYALGLFPEASTQFRQAVRLQEELTIDFPAVSFVQNRLAETYSDLAWFLSQCSDSHFRDPHRAIELAQKAVERAPKNKKTWLALGVANYRAGEWQAVPAALEKAQQVSKDGSSTACFFLAMTHWQLGQKGRARDDYDEAVRLMEKNNSTDQELPRFRKEAALLLGLSDSPNTEGKEVLPPEDPP